MFSAEMCSFLGSLRELPDSLSLDDLRRLLTVQKLDQSTVDSVMRRVRETYKSAKSRGDLDLKTRISRLVGDLVRVGVAGRTGLRTVGEIRRESAPDLIELLGVGEKMIEPLTLWHQALLGIIPEDCQESPDNQE